MLSVCANREDPYPEKRGNQSTEIVLRKVATGYQGSMVFVIGSDVGDRRKCDHGGGSVESEGCTGGKDLVLEFDCQSRRDQEFRGKGAKGEGHYGFC